MQPVEFLTSELGKAHEIKSPLCRIRDAPSGGYEKYYLLWYNAMVAVQRFRGIYRLDLQGLLAICFHADFLLALFFNPEDGGDMGLQNIEYIK
jgi:hypothetical protein